MEISEQGLALIRQFEGFSAQPYRCPAGKLTIGYGHVIRPDECFTSDLSLEQADSMLLDDTAITVQAIDNAITINISQNQLNALADFVYNVGAEAFEKSSLLRILNAGELERASAEFDRWVYAKGQKLDGLVRRRAAERALFEGK